MSDLSPKSDPKRTLLRPHSPIAIEYADLLQRPAEALTRRLETGTSDANRKHELENKVGAMRRQPIKSSPCRFGLG